MLADNSACVLVVGDVEMASRGENVVVKTGEQIADAWMDSRSAEMVVESIIVDPIPPKSRRYIHVPVSKGIKLERIVVFHKGEPKTQKLSIDWNSRPKPEEGPSWSAMYT